MDLTSSGPCPLAVLAAPNFEFFHSLGSVSVGFEYYRNIIVLTSTWVHDVILYTNIISIYRLLHFDICFENQICFFKFSSMFSECIVHVVNTLEFLTNESSSLTRCTHAQMAIGCSWSPASRRKKSPHPVERKQTLHEGVLECLETCAHIGFESS